MDKQTLGKRLQDFFRREIPITRAMGFSVHGWDGKHLDVAARLSKNMNHKKNAFGGSLYSLATMAGWGMARLLAEEGGMNCHVVIQKGSLEYLRPVSKDFRARCPRPDAKTVEAFMQSLKRKGKARLEVACELAEASAAKEAGPAARFQGTFVAVHTRAETDGEEGAYEDGEDDE